MPCQTLFPLDRLCNMVTIIHMFISLQFQRAISLVEVLIALSIFSTAMLGSAAICLHAVRLTHESLELSKALVCE